MSAAVISAAPVKSSRPPLAARGSGGWPRAPAPRRAAASGRLIRKIARQPTVSISQPPSTGPIAAAIAPAGAQKPTARLRARPSKLAPSNGQAVRQHHRRGEALQGARGDQPAEAGGDGAGGRAGGEERRCHHQQAPLAVAIAERAAEQQQRAQRQQVAVDHPLQRVGLAVQAAADRRQPDVDHRAVHEVEAGRQDGRAPGSAAASPRRRL